MTRTSERWKCRPGNFDSLNSHILFPTKNPLGIPELQEQDFDIDGVNLIPFGRKNAIGTKKTSICHFFLDDYRFETTWTRPYKTLQGLRHFQAVMTPDFSLWRDHPLLLQQWNTYRNRWVGRLWQEQGLKVIFTVSWSTEDSYSFCFSGIPGNSIIAIATPRLSEAVTKKSASLRVSLNYSADLHPGSLYATAGPTTPGTT